MRIRIMPRSTAEPFNVPMRHRLEDEIGGPGHDCQEKQNEQRIDDPVFSFRLQLRHLARSTDPKRSKVKLERDQPQICALSPNYQG
jgi:hypothetical protein